MKWVADGGVGGPARGATAHAQGSPVAKRRRTRGGKKRRPTTRLTPDDAFRVAEVVEELVRDVCAGARLLPPQLWPCDDHLPCDSDDECGGCGGCYQDGMLECEVCNRYRCIDVARVR